MRHTTSTHSYSHNSAPPATRSDGFRPDCGPSSPRAAATPAAAAAAVTATARAAATPAAAEVDAAATPSIEQR